MNSNNSLLGQIKSTEGSWRMISLILLHKANTTAASKKVTGSEAIKTKVVRINISSYGEVPKFRQTTKRQKKVPRFKQKIQAPTIHLDPLGWRSVNGSF